MKFTSLSLIILTLWDPQFASVQAFSASRSPHQRCSSTLGQRTRLSSDYGRGSEIWPPPGDEPIRLEQSFPNGVLPDIVLEALANVPPTPVEETAEEEESTTKRRRAYRRVPRAIGRILRRAASAQRSTEAGKPSLMDKTPLVLAAGLVLTGMIRPLDALLVTFLSGYFVILFLWARSLRRDGVTPLLPSLPPQGHVPFLVSNPLEPNFSLSFDYWLKAGALLGLLAPLGMMLRYATTDRMECARACARPLFFVCCQAISEAISRRSLTPLPIRILIPVAYNTVRIGYLWHWSNLPLKLGGLGRALAIANLTYWMANLFGFLIPVAAVKYMRAHFFAVEASEVTMHPGMEDSVGLMF